MQRRVLVFAGLTEIERSEFWAAFRDRYARALTFEFPPSRGFAHQLEPGSTEWTITRGGFWGLRVSVLPQDAAFDSLQVTITPHFPLVEQKMERVGRFLGGSNGTPGILGLVLSHFLFGLLVLAVVALLPFFVAYRISLVRLRADVRTAAQRLDSMGPSLQVFRGGTIRLRSQRSPAATYFYYLAASSAATVVLFGLMDMPGIGNGWSTALLVLSIVLGVLSGVLLIAAILTSLGFEVRK
jgi:hypothetical protein